MVVGNVDAWKGVGVSDAAVYGTQEAAVASEEDQHLVELYKKREAQQQQQQAHLLAARQAVAHQLGVGGGVVEDLETL